LLSVIIQYYYYYCYYYYYYYCYYYSYQVINDYYYYSIIPAKSLMIIIILYFFKASVQFLSQLSMQQAFELLPSSFKRYERDLRELSTSPFQPYVSIDFTKPCILSIQRHAFRGNVLLRRKLPSSGLFLSLFLPFNTEFFSSIRYRRRPGRNCIYTPEL